MIHKSSVINIFCNLCCDRCDLRSIFFIIQYFQTSVHQPGCLNIMSIGIQINQTVPGSVKKYFLSAKFFVIYLICKKIHHKTKPVSCKRILCHTVQFCISLKNMKQGIHRFLCNNTILRKLVILFRLKFAVKSFQISILIRTSVLDHFLKASGNLQCFLVSCCIIIGRESINCECLIIGMLRCI